MPPRLVKKEVGKNVSEQTQKADRGTSNLKALQFKGLSHRPQKELGGRDPLFRVSTRWNRDRGRSSRSVIVNKSVIIAIRNFSTDLVRCITQS
ncbi:hypothetical protein [Microcoleus sp. D2_18a_D3]|uniref:hypothetical protein n=1 Tax=Microcoleus sp. D2_18a_D3 TaxID=3055330 RepID=UPI002FCE95F0